VQIGFGCGLDSRIYGTSVMTFFLTCQLLKKVSLINLELIFEAKKCVVYVYRCVYMKDKECKLELLFQIIVLDPLCECK
jgi:hypothetical protein